MSKRPEEMMKRQTVLEDGRYIIFYTFAPSDSLGAGDIAVPFPEATPDQPEKED